MTAKNVENEELTRNDIELLAANKARSIQNEKDIIELKRDINQLKDTYSVLQKMENQIDHINQKIDKHLSGRTIGDRILDVVVQLIVYGSLFGFMMSQMNGG